MATLSFIDWRERLPFPSRKGRERNYFTPLRLLQLWTLPFVLAIIAVYHQQYGVSDVLLYIAACLLVLWGYYYVGITRRAIFIYLGLSVVGAVVGAVIMERAVQQELHEKDFFVGAEVR